MFGKRIPFLSVGQDGGFGKRGIGTHREKQAGILHTHEYVQVNPSG